MKWVLMSAAATLPLANTVFAEMKVADNSPRSVAAEPNTVESAAAPQAEQTAASTDQAAVEFDTNVLKQRGLDPSLASYFRLAPRFSAGEATVALSVNGNKKGMVKARFNRQGHLCVTPELLQQGGLLVPKALSALASTPAKPGADATEGAACYDYLQDYPQAVFQLSPNDNKVDLIVPSEALNLKQGAVTGNYEHGGNAMLLNYNVIQSGGTGGATPFFQAGTEIGFNAADWLFRSQQTFSSDNGNSQWSHSSAYGQRTWQARKAVVQGGEINLGNTNFSVGSVYGVQIMPEQALADKKGSGAMVQGIAQSQARVEVRQLGALIYSTLVPPGPFSLTDLPIKSTNADLNVTVIEAAGAKRQFVVPSGSFIGASAGSPQGFSAAIGRLKDEGDSDDSDSDLDGTNRNRHRLASPWLATFSKGWALGQSANMSGGALVSSPYQALSLGMDYAPSQFASIHADILSSHSKDGLAGNQVNLALSSQFADNFSASVSASGQTIDYRDLNDVVDDNDVSGSNRSSYSASLGWNSKPLGAFSLGYARSTPFAGPPSSHLFASWGKSFKYFSASLNIDHTIGNTTEGSTPRNQIYANINIPMGQSSVHTYANNNGDTPHIGTQYSQRINDVANYSVATELDAKNHTVMVGGDLNLTPYYTQLGVHVTRNDGNSTQYSSMMSGSVVANGSGVMFSPYAVKDTFGVAQVGDISGVKIDTQSGPVWTDHWGRAVIPSMTEYSESDIRVETKSLPRNVDIGNSIATITPAHGAVSNLKFDVVTARRVLMHVSLPNGQPLAKGVAVLDAANKYMGTVASMGIVMLTNPPLDSQLFVNLSDTQRCKLNYTLPEKSGERFYESANAVCEPVK